MTNIQNRFGGVNVNYERFPPQYFSGCNVYIYFEDIFIDEIERMQFELQEQIMPLHGYNSFVFDKMLRGTRLIQGMFQINFKDSNYISSAVDAILENSEDFNLSDDNLKEINEENTNKLYEFADRGWTTEFKKYSQDFQKKIWGRSEEKNTYIRDRETYFKHQNTSFNIRLSYGDQDQPESRWKAERNYRKKLGVGTIREIQDVHLQSVSQAFDVSGEPIREIYTFMAKDLK